MYSPAIDKYQKFRDSLKNGKSMCGGWVTLSDPKISEIMAVAGFDWVLVDLEHSSIAIDVAELHIRNIKKTDALALCRPTRRDEDQLRRLLDAGADGFILSTLNDPAEIDWATRISRYPPCGERGMGLHAANMYGLHFDSYLAQQRTHPIIIAQIENVAAIKTLDQIVKHPAIDGIFIGPYDLSLSMGIPGDFENPLFTKALESIRQSAAEVNLPVGIHCVDNNIDKFKSVLRDGYQIVGCSLDTKVLMTSALDFCAAVNNFGKH
jgi:2-dehydro-3-deoxyglucarate aldolase